MHTLNPQKVSGVRVEVAAAGDLKPSSRQHCTQTHQADPVPVGVPDICVDI